MMQRTKVMILTCAAAFLQLLLLSNAQAVGTPPTSIPTSLSPAELQSLQSALVNLGLLPAPAAATPSPSPASSGSSSNSNSATGAANSTIAIKDMAKSLIGALEQLQTSTTAGTPSGAAGSSASSSNWLSGLINSTNQAQAASSSNQLYYPLGSGDNLLQFRKRVKAVKEWYKEARTYLGIDNAIRFGGYLNTIENLEIGFINAYPVAELSFMVANLNLGATITNLVGNWLSVAGNPISLVANVISLRIAIVNLQAVSPTPKDSASSASIDPMSYSSFSGLSVNTQQLMSDVISGAEQSSSQLLPWVLSGGPLAPLGLATNFLTAAGESLQRLNSWVPPSITLNQG